MAVLIALTIAVAPCRSAAAEPAALRAWTGAAKPDWTLDGLDGAPVALRAQRDRIVLVHFFATWCEPCRAELPALQRFAARAEAQGVVVLTIAVGDVAQRVRRFADGLNLALPILLDNDRRVAKAWDVYALPTTYVLARDGRPRQFVEQDYDWDDLDPTTLAASVSAPRETSARKSKGG